ncbi:multidrug effflux MFS transporter [Methylopila musalis]|uniref:Bcr/CflA family efflux transporter n=1 Tax=Methylopila musalis TaxID=1134781 RepID=A0ABW3Z3J7_9HYPH
MTSDLSAARPPARFVRLIAALAALAAFAPFATDMYLASFPDIAASFGATLGDAQLSLSIFFFGLAVGQIAYGPLIDSFGRKGPLCAGVATFAAASALALFAPNMPSFIALRFLQALGGCAGMVIGRAIIGDLFVERDAARALSFLMLVQGLGPILAPILGGYVAAAGGWRAVFVFLTAFGLLCLALAWRLVPETLPPAERRRLRFADTLRTFGSLLRRRAFAAPTLAGGLSFACMFAFITGSSEAYMEIHGVSERSYGWLFALNACGMVAAAAVNGALLRVASPARIVTAALALGALGGAALAAFGAIAPLPALVAMLWLTIAATPIVGANTMAIALGQAGDHRGAASALIGVTQFALAGLVSAVVGAFHNGTVYPMTVAIFVCGLAALAVWLLGGRSRG